MTLTSEQEKDLPQRGYTRRSFGRIAALVGAGASTLSFYNEAAMAQGLSRVEAPPDAVLINANENPLGPCEEARQACHNMVQYGGRYRYSEGDKLQRMLAEQEWLVANKPKGSVVMIDEAYTHFSNAPFNSPMVAADKDVIILRTFSKVYGMAGLRAGAAFARPDIQKKINTFSTTMMAITGMAAASTSLGVKDLVPKRRKIVADTREGVFSWLSEHNFSYKPSVSNCFMIDVKRPGHEVIQAMAKEKVYIGRVWPVWPNSVRITVGTPEEMTKFKAAFLKVMA